MSLFIRPELDPEEQAIVDHYREARRLIAPDAVVVDMLYVVTPIDRALDLTEDEKKAVADATRIAAAGAIVDVLAARK